MLDGGEHVAGARTCVAVGGIGGEAVAGEREFDLLQRGAGAGNLRGRGVRRCLRFRRVLRGAGVNAHISEEPGEGDCGGLRRAVGARQDKAERAGGVVATWHCGREVVESLNRRSRQSRGWWGFACEALRGDGVTFGDEQEGDAN